MEVTVLGSRGGYPLPGEPCSGYLVEEGTTRVWVDAGAGTLDALLRRMDPWSLDAVWISHLHPDHWTDLPIALHRMAVTADLADRPAPVVFGPPGWDEAIGVALQAYPEARMPYRAVHLTDGASFDVGDLHLTGHAVEHGCPAFGLRVQGAGGVLAYSADTRPCDAVGYLAAGADLFLCEATLSPGTSNPISTNAEEAGQLASAAGVDRLLLTHLLEGVDPDRSLDAAVRSHDGPVELARPRDTHVV
ncbi:MBL fold metallo-hydrolase [Nitriliruptor alkaliphilus]|uniref:MBL fold metallo-hydrolase n=1 Tax=Nitriliruptor alkaliphilus TaxID=427918 RepID=UPI000698D1E7|nr:MBL fold metallo-hydrolase [Nitriliruptor alkaliphilus]